MSILYPEKIKYIAIHCSDSPNGRKDTIEDVHLWHLQKGWDGVGYHFVIERDGSLRTGRPLFWEGAHIEGFNDESIGICLIGTDEFTDAQWRQLRVTIGKLLIRFKGAKVVGHYQLDPDKPCPNFDVDAWMRGGL